MLESKMELYTIACSFRACLCFSFPWKITHPAFILRTSLSSLEIWRTEVFSKFLAQCSKSLCHKCSQPVLDYLAGLWAWALANPRLDSKHSEPEVFCLILSPKLVINALLLSYLMSSHTSSFTHQGFSSPFRTCSESSWVTFCHTEPAWEKQQPGSSPELSSMMKSTFGNGCRFSTWL